MTMKHYSTEFRLQSARLVVEQGGSYVEAARRSGRASDCHCDDCNRASFRSGTL